MKKSPTCKTKAQGYVTEGILVLKNWNGTSIVFVSKIDFSTQTFDGTVIWATEKYHVGEQVSGLPLDDYELVYSDVTITDILGV
jgi:hypothetical protein